VPVGVDEDLELIAAIVAVMFALPFLMVWVERRLDPATPPGQRRRGFRRRR